MNYFILGLKAFEDVRNDLIKAREIGAEKFESFINKRCLKDSEENFFDPVKK